VFGFMNPVIGVLLSALLLSEKEALGAGSLLALMLVCLGIYVVNKEPK
ncbi:MAG: EamA/RhaT family transporter, partial [Eubacterium sp.]|nr:EamA/RhaT family transporter [Eubacterium sp.]